MYTYMELGIKCKRYQRLFSKLALGLLALVAIESQAAMCEPYDVTADRDLTIPVLGPSTITVAEDLAVGAKIYGQSYVIKDGDWGWRCTWPISEAPLTIQPVFTMEAVSTPSGAPTTSGSTTVFPTNIPGIGFTITEHYTTSNNALYPSKVFGTPATSIATGLAAKGHGSGLLQMEFIKTGPIATNTGNQQILFSSLPTFHASLGVTSPVPFDHVIWKIKFSGAVNIVTRTCQVDDVDVELGSHQISDMPKALSASKWTDFNITLKNCPPFLGYPFSASSFIHDEKGNLQGYGTMRNNTMDMYFTSVHGNYTSYIANIESGPDSAVGFGIQMATQSSSDANINLAGSRTTQSTLGVVFGNVDGASYTIPLKARYYRYLGAGAMPGKANGAVMFTINYY